MVVPKKNKYGELVFNDFPDFRPNVTPKEMFQSGSFGGTYWRPIYSNVTKKNYKEQHLEFPQNWWKGIQLTNDKCSPQLNKYKVRVGTSLKFWEDKGWITHQDPYGWVQWYCRFYKGRRSEDDLRQIKRWKALAGPQGRFRKWLVTLINKKKSKYNDFSISPKIRQTLLHWGYEITKRDFNNEILQRNQKEFKSK